MIFKSIHNKAIFSFLSFIIAIIKDILVIYFKLLPIRSVSNWLLSYFFILPILIIGLFFSMQVISRNYNSIKDKKSKFWDQNLLLSIPTPLCFIYGIVRLIVLT